MNIPTIGGTRGIFDIFVPGVFLLLNFGIVIYVFPYIDANTRSVISSLMTNSILDLIIAICFGYLTGVLLRLIKTDSLDSLSSTWLMAFDKKAQKEFNQFPGKHTKPLPWWKPIFSRKIREHKTQYYKGYAAEEFPYIGWLEHVARKYLPYDALEFYNEVWAKRKLENNTNKQFFNFCKIVVTSNDDKAANEIYAAEALTRYIAGMFYALQIASVLIVIAMVFVRIETGQWMSGMLLILGIYLFAMHIIIQRFRKMRIREVEVIFATSYKNRELFHASKIETGGKPE